MYANYSGPVLTCSGSDLSTRGSPRRALGDCLQRVSQIPERHGFPTDSVHLYLAVQKLPRSGDVVVREETTTDNHCHSQPSILHGRRSRVGIFVVFFIAEADEGKVLDFAQEIFQSFRERLRWIHAK